MKKACAGSISVFYSMIFLFVLAFLGSLFLYGKQRLMQTGIRSDLDAAGLSVLGEYQKDWIQEYGLYVLPKDQLESDMLFYMEENGRHSWGSYSVSDLSVTQAESLADISVLQEQILMFMEERGLFDFIEEVGTSILQIQELENQVEEEVNWKESDELLLVQQLYGQLVTDSEGIRADGGRNPYSINHLLEDEPTADEVMAVFQTTELTSEQLSILEQAYYELDQVALLCEDAWRTGGELEKALASLEKKDELPITEAQLRQYSAVWKKNQVICEEVSAALQSWIVRVEEDPDQMESISSETLMQLEQLADYDRSAALPYEYRESENDWDFSSILSALRGYPFDVGDIAPDEDLNLGLEEDEEEDELNLDGLTIDDSFGDQFLVTEYVLGIFQNFQETAAAKKGEKSFNLRGEEKKGRFFNNEVEYLLIGKANEYDNVNGTKNYIVALRSILNMVHLLTDSEKRAEIELLAGTIGGILLPGIGNGVFFGIILTAWSLGEAIVDYQVLVEGGEVPLLKSKDSWRTDLSSILTLDIPDAEEKPGNGMNYEQYLRVMLYTVNQEKLLKRVQNLLYLNHQKQSLAEMVTGFIVEGTAKGTFSEFAFSGEYRYASYKKK